MVTIYDFILTSVYYVTIQCLLCNHPLYVYLNVHLTELYVNKTQYSWKWEEFFCFVKSLVGDAYMAMCANEFSWNDVWL